MKNNFDLKKFLVENKLTTNSKNLNEVLKYDEDGMVKNTLARQVAFKNVRLPQEFADRPNQTDDIPIDFIGFRSNEKGTTRNNGSFSVTIFAKRSDNKPLLKQDKFQINSFVTKDYEDDGQSWYPQFDEYGSITPKKTPVEPRDVMFKYIKDNLLRIKNSSGGAAQPNQAAE